MASVKNAQGLDPNEYDANSILIHERPIQPGLVPIDDEEEDKNENQHEVIHETDVGYSDGDDPKVRKDTGLKKKRKGYSKKMTHSQVNEFLRFPEEDTSKKVKCNVWGKRAQALSKLREDHLKAHKEICRKCNKERREEPDEEKKKAILKKANKELKELDKEYDERVLHIKIKRTPQPRVPFIKVKTSLFTLTHHIKSLEDRTHIVFLLFQTTSRVDSKGGTSMSCNHHFGDTLEKCTGTCKVSTYC